MSEFLSPLELEYIDGKNWKVIAPFEYHFGSPDGDELVDIPVGFITDFASIPKILWNILPPVGSYGKAAVVHDWLYRRRTVVFDCLVCETGHPLRSVSRREADYRFREAMQVLGTDWLTRWVIWAGVRLGGWWAWRQDARG